VQPLEGDHISFEGTTPGLRAHTPRRQQMTSNDDREQPDDEQQPYPWAADGFDGVDDEDEELDDQGVTDSPSLRYAAPIDG
jgi:hypothetical protein